MPMSFLDHIRALQQRRPQPVRAVVRRRDARRLPPSRLRCRSSPRGPTCSAIATAPGISMPRSTRRTSARRRCAPSCSSCASAASSAGCGARRPTRHLAVHRSAADGDGARRRAVVRRARLRAAHDRLCAAQRRAAYLGAAALLHKPTFPGELDNTVAGGQPAGIGLHDNLIKECAEEASIPRDARRAGQGRELRRLLESVGPAAQARHHDLLRSRTARGFHTARKRRRGAFLRAVAGAARVRDGARYHRVQIQLQSGVDRFLRAPRDAVGRRSRLRSSSRAASSQPTHADEGRSTPATYNGIGSSSDGASLRIRGRLDRVCARWQPSCHDTRLLVSFRSCVRVRRSVIIRLHRMATASRWPARPGPCREPRLVQELKQPGTGYSCCNGTSTAVEGDCRPTRAYLNEDGKWYALLDGRWMPVPPRVVLKQLAPDGSSHICASKSGMIYCFLGGSPKI